MEKRSTINVNKAAVSMRKIIRRLSENNMKMKKVDLDKLAAVGLTGAAAGKALRVVLCNSQQLTLKSVKCTACKTEILDNDVQVNGLTECGSVIQLICPNPECKKKQCQFLLKERLQHVSQTPNKIKRPGPQALLKQRGAFSPLPG